MNEGTLEGTWIIKILGIAAFGSIMIWLFEIKKICTYKPEQHQEHGHTSAKFKGTRGRYYLAILLQRHWLTAKKHDATASTYFDVQP